MKHSQFKKLIWNYYKENKRPFAWRETTNPYQILVSEIMLQQTQTQRVNGKYQAFIGRFPTFAVLAQASLRAVLACWQGLGYNRRAKALHTIAQRIVDEHHGKLPSDPEELIKLPGIGPATSCSICAFAFNMPTVFIETNIRTVFLHFFFPDKIEVHDKQLLPLIAATVDKDHPREWYYALMDYGVFLKQKLPNPSRRSVHHNKQSSFEGSDRQIRGKILKYLTQNGFTKYTQLIADLGAAPERTQRIIHKLEQEKFIRTTHQGVLID